LNIPRDEILKHGFVLEPLAELYPDGLHPIEKITFLELWNRLKDDLDASQKI
jgi:2-amino-4-hydroxy-6-hydroxymethyldihydropteridine diphosphokinase